jgi:hypothetical protein
MKDFLKMLALVLLVMICIQKCDSSEWSHEYDRKQEANRAELAKPKIVSASTDGCTVYSFYTNTTHYFTRCGSTTTTDRTYTEQNGKQSIQKIESIVTENKP